MIEALLHLVLQLMAGWLAAFGHPAPPAPAVPPVAVTAPSTTPTPAPVAVSPPTSSTPVPQPAPAPVVPPVLAQPGPAAPPADPSCEDGEQWQGDLGCVAVQLPEESDGRAYG